MSKPADIPKIINEISEKESSDLLSTTLDNLAKTILKEGRAAVRDIADKLNEFERRSPRRDPALRGLRTDQWRATIHEIGRMGNSKGQYTLSYKIKVVNMQKPFYYELNYGKKNTMRTRRSYIANLAAVRLSQTPGRVVPRRKKGVIVFWGSKRVGDNNSEGYVFVKSRNKSGPGHEWYRQNVMSIIDDRINEWLDSIEDMR